MYYVFECCQEFGQVGFFCCVVGEYCCYVVGGGVIVYCYCVEGLGDDGGESFMQCFLIYLCVGEGEGEYGCYVGVNYVVVFCCVDDVCFVGEGDVCQFGLGVGGYDGGCKGQCCVFKFFGQMFYVVEYFVYWQQVVDDVGGCGDDFGFIYCQYVCQGVGYVCVVLCFLLFGGCVCYVCIDYQGVQWGVVCVQFVVVGYVGGGSCGVCVCEGLGVVMFVDYVVQVGFVVWFDVSGYCGGVKVLGKGYVR